VNISNGSERRVLVVSHPAVLAVNRTVYAELARRGWSVTVVLPDRWRHSYSQDDITPEARDGDKETLEPVRVLAAGHPQRHLYLARCSAIGRRVSPQVAFVEAEPFALGATQWRMALNRAGVPFGVQCYENLDRRLPAPVRAMRSRVLRDAAFVAARSETAGRLARAWGATGEVALVPPAVPTWEPVADADPDRPFTVGYAGRLVADKGIEDLLAAAGLLGGPLRLVFIGAGELADTIAGAAIPGVEVRVHTGVSHECMAQEYAQLDVLVLPSRTAPTWKEQFGRVIVEALSCGVPVVGSDSGEIPWLIGLTGGGLVFPESDAPALANRLGVLRDDPQLRRRLAAAGGAAVARLFSVPAATDALERLLLGTARGAPSG
jgi:glycosyltransferase involved in cell wall biosynthesis